MPDIDLVLNFFLVKSNGVAVIEPSRTYEMIKATDNLIESCD